MHNLLPPACMQTSFVHNDRFKYLRCVARTVPRRVWGPVCGSPCYDHTHTCKIKVITEKHLKTSAREVMVNSLFLVIPQLSTKQIPTYIMIRLAAVHKYSTTKCLSKMTST